MAKAGPDWAPRLKQRTIARLYATDALGIHDDASLLRVTQHNLSRVGHDVLCADSAAAGLSLLESERVDVVVTDLQMPGKTGLELLLEVSASYPTVVTIIITAHSTVRSAVEAMKLGAMETGGGKA